MQSTYLEGIYILFHICTSFCSIFSVHALHCSCHPFLQHNVISVWQYNLSVQTPYLSFPHIWRSIRSKVAGERATYGEHILKHASEWPVFFSPVSACIHASHCNKSRQHHTHSRSNWMCISDFTEQRQKHHTWKVRSSVVPLCKWNSPTMTLQIKRTRAFFTAVAWVAVKNALSKGSGSTLTVLLQVMKLPANQRDYFPRVTPSDHLVLATTMYKDCPERCDFLQNKGQSWSFVWVMKQPLDHRNVLDGKENNAINFLTPGRNNTQLLAQHKLLKNPNKLHGRKEH